MTDVQTGVTQHGMEAVGNAKGWLAAQASNPQRIVFIVAVVVAFWAGSAFSRGRVDEPVPPTRDGGRSGLHMHHPALTTESERVSQLTAQISTDVIPAFKAEVRPPGRYAVLGLSRKQSLKSVYRLARSLRHTAGWDVDLIFFTETYPWDVAWVYDKFRATVVTYNGNVSTPELPSSFPKKLQGLKPTTYRWFLIRQYLEALPPSQRYDGGLVTFALT
jgi:hypothetical protein